MTTVHLDIQNVVKRFGTHAALSGIDLAIEQGSFVCLLGPSGCGKTTLLRIIAGFEHASEGRLILDGQDISRLPPHKRDFGMVFQSLALFPHMSVADNIAYGLKLRGVEVAKRRSRVDELLHVVHLPHIADRPVSQLSGGQRQRVAIARALAVRPKLFLLDEPLSALDAQLRDSMQIELRQLQQQFGITTILVTHDQTEAMMLADTLVVMKQGRIEQVGTPSDVYRWPQTPFAAEFLGAANLVEGRVVDATLIEALGGKLPISNLLPVGARTRLALRAEDIHLRAVEDSPNSPQVVVDLVRDIGAAIEVIVRAGQQSLRCRLPVGEAGSVTCGRTMALTLAPGTGTAFLN